mgnify:CR=1 FL=1
MTELIHAIADSVKLSGNIAENLKRRTDSARNRFTERVDAAWQALAADRTAGIGTPFDWFKHWFDYSVDSAQRTVLFWDTLRRRGNAFVEHERAGKPPVLHFEHETVLDARTFERPVNYALLRIKPPRDVEVDPNRRPYVVIDPRAGHGPGIGGFKDDSQVGVALRAGHPVYFVIFFPDPMPGQTLLDVCAAEARFVHHVRELHPNSPKPAIVGNCQGGWAAMMLAASNPDDTGPVVINGAPMSYWSGAWAEGEGDNPMRYAGGLLGGSWLASLTADLGNGIFDGAHLVQNFEYLNPANTFWDKYYHLFANIDTEPPRFLEFERWWGGFYLLNRQEIEWIVHNLFVGNRIWAGTERAESGGGRFDLRDIKVPIVMFASMGDNITPPQQAFNWVADVYGSTEEIKARGQTIVGLVHGDVGHLGIFVSGRVAKKEHAQIVSVLKSIERLPPGLWAMQIHERKRPDGGVEYDVEFSERSLEEVVAHNRMNRRDERAFDAVADLSELNQRMYEFFVRPFARAVSNDVLAELGRRFHPLRLTRWALSDLNPATWWLESAAESVRSQRAPTRPDHPLRKGEQFASELISASFDLYRDLRDAASEAVFFHVYGNLFLFNAQERLQDGSGAVAAATDPRSLSVVRDALSAIDRGGYAEAVARAAYMLERRDGPLPLWRLQLRDELVRDYGELLPSASPEEWRRIRGVQEIIVRHEPQRALASLATLLARPEDRERFLTLLERVLADERVQPENTTPEQRDALARIREVLTEPAAPRPAARAGRAAKRDA